MRFRLGFKAAVVDDPMRVETIYHPSGDELPILVDEDGLPLPDANEWILGRRGLSPATLARALNELVPLFRWATTKHLDLRERIESGRGLTEAEVKGGIVEALRRDQGRNRATKIAVSPAVLNQRISTCAAFIDWIATSSLGLLSSDDKRCQRIERTQKLITQWLDASLVSKDGKSPSLTKALTEDQQRYLEETLNPELSGYGRRLSVKFRNYVAVMLLLLCGLRRGELLSLRVQDVQFGAIPCISVIRRRPDKDDPRRPRPRVKRLSRVIPLDPFFAKALNQYIMIHREDFLMSAKVDSEYLILSDEGIPLSIPRLYAIFVELRRKLSTHLPEDFSPHSLRHTFSVGLERALRAVGMDESRRAQALALLRGDSSVESQNVYLAKEIQDRAHVALSSYQRQMLAKVELDELPF